MQVQSVDFVISQQVNVLGHILDAEKVPGHIQHGPAPGEARAVADRARLHFPWSGLDRRCVNAGWQQLSDSLHAVEQAGRLVGYQLDQFRRDDQLIAFIAECRVCAGQAQRDAVGRRTIHCLYLDGVAGCWVKMVCQVLTYGFDLIRGRIYINNRTCRQAKDSAGRDL